MSVSVTTARLNTVPPFAGCSYAAVERINRDAMQPLLSELVKAPFFRYFKTDLYCECPLWPDDGMCSLRDCSVCECEPEEVPEPWRKDEVDAKHESCESELFHSLVLLIHHRTGNYKVHLLNAKPKLMFLQICSENLT